MFKLSFEKPSDNVGIIFLTSSSVICFGAGRTGVDELQVLACGNCYIITGGTQQNSPLYSGIAFWYYGSGSIGFAPTSVKNQSSGDTYDIASEFRMSWHIGSPGFRAGSYVTYESDYSRYVYMLNSTFTPVLQVFPIGST